MTLPAARELGKYGIRVISIAPGIFDTPMMEKVTPAIRNSLEAQIPFPQRFGQPSEFAQLVQQIIENRPVFGMTKPVIENTPESFHDSGFERCIEEIPFSMLAFQCIQTALHSCAPRAVSI